MTTRDKRIILLTGVNGQIGFELARSLQGLGKIVACDRSKLDLADLDGIRQVVRDLRPDVIVNPAAYTGVDKAEDSIADVMRINAEAPGVLAEEAKRLNSLLVHYSTDYVFSGRQATPYSEEDVPDPQNVYGCSKLAGEQAIKATECQHLVLRTSWVYSRRGSNFLLTMLRLAQQHSEVKVVCDQIGAPTWSVTIAEMTAHILAHGLRPEGAAWLASQSGVYHLTSSGAASWADFAEAIFDTAAIESRPRVVRIPSSEYATPAKRPSNSRLNNEKIESIFGLQTPEWREGLKLCLAE